MDKISTAQTEPAPNFWWCRNLDYAAKATTCFSDDVFMRGHFRGQ